MGGGAIRAASKVVGFTVPSGGLRGVKAEHFTASSGSRRAASLRPVAATAEEVKLVASNLETGVRRPCSEVDDWVLSGRKEDVAVGAAETMPRVVFGEVPSLEEAKEATSELTDSLEKTYLLPTSSAGYEGSVGAQSESGLLTKACAASEISIAPAVPAPVIMAFRSLKESPAVQNVVTSIVSDPKVWDAMLRNQELQGFLQSQRTCLASSEMDLNTELVADSYMLDQSPTKTIDDSSDDGESKPVGGLANFFLKIKSTVFDMTTSLSDFFVNFVGGKGAKGSSPNSGGTATPSLSDFFENFFGGKGSNRSSPNSGGTAAPKSGGIGNLSANTFMGLAIMFIMLILLKRA